MVSSIELARQEITKRHELEYKSIKDKIDNRFLEHKEDIITNLLLDMGEFEYSEMFIGILFDIVLGRDHDSLMSDEFKNNTVNLITEHLKDLGIYIKHSSRHINYPLVYTDLGLKKHKKLRLKQGILDLLMLLWVILLVVVYIVLLKYVIYSVDIKFGIFIVLLFWLLSIFSIIPYFENRKNIFEKLKERHICNESSIK